MTVKAASDYANGLSAGGWHAEAERLQRAVLEGVRRTYGDEYPVVRECAARYAKILRKVHRGENAFSIETTCLGQSSGRPPLRYLPDNEYVAERPIEFGSSPVAAEFNGLLEEAAAKCKQKLRGEVLSRYACVLELYRPTLSADDATVGTLLVRMASPEADLGCSAAAERHGRDALAVLQRQPIPSPLDLANAGIGRALAGQGRYAEAEAPLRAALAARATLLGKARPDTRRVVGALVKTLRHTGRPGEAEALRTNYEKASAATRPAAATRAVTDLRG